MLLLAPSLAADWPQFRGPNRDGISDETGLLASWPEGGPRELWRIALGEGFSGISVVDGRIFTLYASGDDELAGCFDAATGEARWTYRLDSKWEDRFGNGPRSTPTVDGGLVYVLSANGKLAALNVEDGKPAWTKDLQAVYEAKPPEWGVSTSPQVEGEMLLVNVGGKGASVVAFDKKTGKEVWKTQSDPAGYSAPLTVEVDGVRQVIFFTATGLLSLSPKDGSLLWKQAWKTSYDVNATTPIFIAPNRIFVSTGYDVGAAVYKLKSNGEKFGVDEVWRNREMKNKFSSSVLHDGHIYGFDEKTLKCINAATGETRWQHRDLGHGSLLYADGHLIALGDAGQLALVEATPDEFRQKGSAQVFKGKTWTVPTLVGGRLYLRDEKQLVSMIVSEKKG
jgi:outer membrane protein assembly factor BamB